MITTNQTTTDTFTLACEARRQIENTAYNLLDKSYGPYWGISFDDLFFAAIDHLTKRGWDIEEGTDIDQQVAALCRGFLGSKDYRDMVEDAYYSYYETQADKQELWQINRNFVAREAAALNF